MFRKLHAVHIVFVVGLLFLALCAAGIASADSRSHECVFSTVSSFSLDGGDSVIDKIINFLYMVIQAMISVFCKIVRFAGFHCS